MYKGRINPYQGNDQACKKNDPTGIFLLNESIHGGQNAVEHLLFHLQLYPVLLLNKNKQAQKP